MLRARKVLKLFLLNTNSHYFLFLFMKGIYGAIEFIFIMLVWFLLPAIVSVAVKRRKTRKDKKTLLYLIISWLLSNAISMAMLENSKDLFPD